MSEEEYQATLKALRDHTAEVPEMTPEEARIELREAGLLGADGNWNPAYRE